MRLISAALRPLVFGVPARRAHGRAGEPAIGECFLQRFAGDLAQPDKNGAVPVEMRDGEEGIRVSAARTASFSARSATRTARIGPSGGTGSPYRLMSALSRGAPRQTPCRPPARCAGRVRVCLRLLSPRAVRRSAGPRRRRSPRLTTYPRALRTRAPGAAEGEDGEAWHGHARRHHDTGARGGDLTWRYPAPYDSTTSAASTPRPCLIRGTGSSRWCRSRTNVGFRTFGADGRVPGGDYDESASTPAAGCAPSLTGQGLGRQAITTGLEFGGHLFGPASVPGDGGELQQPGAARGDVAVEASAR